MSMHLARSKYASQLQPMKVLPEKAILKSFAKFTGKLLYPSLFLIELHSGPLQVY